MFLFGNTKELFVGNTCVRFSLSPICLVSHLDDAHIFWFAVDFPHFGLLTYIIDKTELTETISTVNCL